mmetsp:Transcript_106825/g.276150  ORF Transcript_106825/g.276150 Transcript_106825/m.276150 type:complete len:261 (+) Transcript_106825:1474-2256(+)
MPADRAADRDSYNGWRPPTCRKVLEPPSAPAASATKRAANLSGSTSESVPSWTFSARRSTASAPSLCCCACASPPEDRWVSAFSAKRALGVAPRRRSARVATIASYFSAASRRSTRMPASTEPSSCKSACVPWCLESTAMAFLRFVIACTMSFSSSRNLAASSSRMAVACCSLAVLSLISCCVSAISAVSTPCRALRPSTSVSSLAAWASASATALVFSFSLVSHQQTILSYISDSLSASASNSDFIFCRRFTTRFTGLE